MLVTVGDDGFERMGLCVRFLIHRLATGGRRFFGEYQGPIEEGEFTDVAQVVSDSGARETDDTTIRPLDLE